ncbi:MAG: metallophosphoesterase [Anaerolineae bacterium]|nr:metallophosphoesterase [Anaerolineae bacterium]
MRKKLSRRDFLKLLKAGAIELALLILGGAGYGFLLEPGRVKVESVSLRLRRLTQAFHGIRIAQISDIHMGGWMNVERLGQVADTVVAQQPDLLLLTGDFLIGHVFNKASEQHIQDLINVLTPLAKSIPSFAILGNHDYWTNPDAVREMLKSSGIMDLTNSVFTLSRGNERLHLCGVDDVWEGIVRLEDVLNQIKDDGPAILLAHEPDFADQSAVTGRFDLQVSGHSHGGQVVFPFLGPPILPYLGQKYPSGLYEVREMYQHTNRGVGTGRLPVRINCPPEITLFTLEANSKISVNHDFNVTLSERSLRAKSLG